METSLLKKCENCRHYQLIIDPITGESVYRCANTLEPVFRSGNCLDWEDQYRRWFCVLSTGETIPLFAKYTVPWKEPVEEHIISPVFPDKASAIEWYKEYQKYRNNKTEDKND